MSLTDRNTREIESDAALIYFGACLAAINVLTALFWLTVEPLDRILAPTEAAVCWPFFARCAQVRFLSGSTIHSLTVAFGVAAALNSMLFLKPAHARSGYWLLLVMTVMKGVIVAQDYRLIHNEHYMAMWATGVYLFVPYKRYCLPRLLVGFYVWSGLLKLNGDWISGAGLYGRRPLGLPAALVPTECIYVILLELVMSFGLLLQRRWLFRCSFFQIALFHVASFWVVGYFYPILMALILSVLVLVRVFPRADEAAVPNFLGRLTPMTVATGIVALFSAFQLIPRLYPGVPALTGEGRMFALHMFDSPIGCRGYQVFRASDGSVTRRAIWPRFVYPRIACDPIVYISLATQACQQQQNSPAPPPEFDLVLEVKKREWLDYRSLVSISGFCGSHTTYRVIGHNPWIRPLS